MPGRYMAVVLAAVWLAAGAQEIAAQVKPAAAAPRWLPATPEHLPRWHGFNLLEKFHLESGRKAFVEEDFRLISKLGFNFVRLPMDYRLWVRDGNWEEFDEPTLREIDQAVQWGERYGLHVCLNFHRAPGYTVAKPPEPTRLWTDAETQRVCAKHWSMFARRYKGIPSRRLSFNLINEPGDVDPEAYLAVVRKLVDAIRAEDPDRLIIADGLQWGRVPLAELRGLRVAQATRGYAPGELTHYKASWVDSAHFPEPRWPRLQPPNGTLLSPRKKEGSHALIIDGPFPDATELRLRVLTVSDWALLVVEADSRSVFKKNFQCGPGEGEWKKAEFKPHYNLYQNIYDRDYTAIIPAGTRQVRVRVADGDWLQIGHIGLKSAGTAGKEATLTLDEEWGRKPEPLRYAPGTPDGPFIGVSMQDKAWLWVTCIQPWQRVQAQGIGVMVGEWGAFNQTPHAVFLRWRI